MWFKSHFLLWTITASLHLMLYALQNSFSIFHSPPMNIPTTTNSQSSLWSRQSKIRTLALFWNFVYPSLLLLRVLCSLKLTEYGTHKQSSSWAEGSQTHSPWMVQEAFLFTSLGMLPITLFKIILLICADTIFLLITLSEIAKLQL